MKTQRIEKHMINKNHIAWKSFDEYCFNRIVRNSPTSKVGDG